MTNPTPNQSPEVPTNKPITPPESLKAEFGELWTEADNGMGLFPKEKRARIVVCVNFCRGVESDKLENDSLVALIDRHNKLAVQESELRTELTQLKKQRDDLSIAYQDCRDECDRAKDRANLLEDGKEYQKQFTVHHSDGTTETLNAPVFKDKQGDECLTAEAVFAIDFYKAKYELGLTKKELSQTIKELEDTRVERNRLGKFKSSSEAYQKQVEHLKSELEKAREEIESVKNSSAYLTGSEWHEDSSLEKWFPFTAKELIDWKSRAEKAEQERLRPYLACLKCASVLLPNEVCRLCECREAKEKAEQAVRELEKYAKHDPTCRDGNPHWGPPSECHCGLSELQDNLRKRNK